MVLLFFTIKFFLQILIVTMFGLQNRRNMKSQLFSNRFLINRTNLHHKMWENVKENSSSENASSENELESKLVKFPVETFSSEVSGIQMPETKMSTMIETKNSPMINKLQRGGFTAHNLVGDKTEVHPVSKKENSDNEYIVSKSEESINPQVKQNIIHSRIKDKHPNKKLKTSIYDIQM